MGLEKLDSKRQSLLFLLKMWLINCSEANREFAVCSGEFVYPRDLLLGLVSMTVFDEGLSFWEDLVKNSDRDWLYVLAGI